MPSLPLDSQDPRELGPFRLLGRLGEGGQGVVFLGEDQFGQKVAVKLLKAGTDAAARGAMQKEMAAAQRVARFCTARVIEASAEGPRPFVVSEYVDGPSLEDRVAQQGPLEEGDLDRLVVNTASALRAIHAAGVVHRDLKPANVLLGPDGPRVVDFGIARQKGSQTLTGRLVGTPAYMAPEQFEGRPASYASDVFAWAGTMAFAATGRPPFGEGTNIAAIMRSVVSSEPDLDGVPQNLLPLFRRCFAKDPDQRPTARDLLDLLLDPGAGMAEDEDLVRTMRTAKGLLNQQTPADGTDQLIVGPVGRDGQPEDIPHNAVEAPAEPEAAEGEREPDRSIPPGSSFAPAPYPAAVSIPPTTSYQPSTEVTAADRGKTIPPGAGHVAPPYQPGVLPPPAPPPAPNWNSKPWPETSGKSGRGRMLAAAAVVVVLAAAVGAWLLLDDGGPGHKDAPTVPAPYGAIWQGTADTSGGITTRQVPIQITLYAGKSTGTAEFHDLACNGTLTLTGSGPTGLTFQLTASNQCPSGNVDMHFKGPDLVYHLLGPNGLTQNGTLTRSR
jgi:serine/threonine protein kinase